MREGDAGILTPCSRSATQTYVLVSVLFFFNIFLQNSASDLDLSSGSKLSPTAVTTTSIATATQTPADKKEI